MSVIYKSLKEIKGMKSTPAKGGGMRPPKKPGSKRALIVIVCAVVAATLILGITGYWLMTELEQAGPDIAELKRRRAEKQAKEQAQQQAQLPAQKTPQQAAPAPQPSAQGADAEKIVEDGLIIDPLKVPVNATVVLDVQGHAPESAPDSKPQPANTTAESMKTEAESGTAQSDAASKSTYTVSLPAEPTTEDEREKVKQEKQEKAFLSKVQRNQRVMKLQKTMNRARKYNDAAKVASALSELKKLLGANSFLVLQWEGNLAVMDKEYRTAEQKYRRALTLKPHDLHCRMNLALALIGGGRFPMADRELDSLQQDYPENEGVEKLRALLIYRMSHAPPKPLINDLHKEAVPDPKHGTSSATGGQEVQTSVQ